MAVRLFVLSDENQNGLMLKTVFCSLVHYTVGGTRYRSTFKSVSTPGEDGGQCVCSVWGALAPPQIDHLGKMMIVMMMQMMLCFSTFSSPTYTHSWALSSRPVLQKTQLLLSTMMCRSLKVFLEDVFDGLVTRSNIALDDNFGASKAHLWDSKICLEKIDLLQGVPWHIW